MELKNKPPPPSSWSDAEETPLKELRDNNIKLIDAALGRERLNLQQQSVAHLLNMTEEERLISNLPAELLDTMKNAVEI